VHAPAAVGWQPSRFLADRGEAERAFALAEQLGSVNAAVAELGTTWPSLRKAFSRHGLGMPARNPEAVRQRAIAAADTRRPGPRDALPLDRVFVALNPGQLPAPRGPKAEQGVRLRRAEEIETLSYRTVVELDAESRLAPERRVPQSPAAPNAPNGWPTSGSGARTAARPNGLPAANVPAGLSRSSRRGGCWPMRDRPSLPEPTSDQDEAGSAPIWPPT
jgi:hypothetical protein